MNGLIDLEFIGTGLFGITAISRRCQSLVDD